MDGVRWITFGGFYSFLACPSDFLFKSCIGNYLFFKFHVNIPEVKTAICVATASITKKFQKEIKTFKVDYSS